MFECAERLQAEIRRLNDAAVEDIRYLIFGHDHEPCDLCSEVCAHYNGTCVAGVLAGFTDKCCGFYWRGPREEVDNGETSKDTR